MNTRVTAPLTLFSQHSRDDMGHESTPVPITLVYKTLSGSDPDSDGRRAEVPFHLDVYPPNSPANGLFTSGDDSVEVPAVVYFHGGGLVNGNRKSWFPEWLFSECHRRFLRFVYLQS